VDAAILLGALPPSLSGLPAAQVVDFWLCCGVRGVGGCGGGEFGVVGGMVVCLSLRLAAQASKAAGQGVGSIGWIQTNVLPGSSRAISIAGVQKSRPGRRGADKGGQKGCALLRLAGGCDERSSQGFCEKRGLLKA